jgi:hypothetical protein
MSYRRNSIESKFFLIVLVVLFMRNIKDLSVRTLMLRNALGLLKVKEIRR